MEVVVTTGAMWCESSSQIVTTSKPTLSFQLAECPSCCPTNSVKAPNEQQLYHSYNSARLHAQNSTFMFCSTGFMFSRLLQVRSKGTPLGTAEENLLEQPRQEVFFPGHCPSSCQTHSIKIATTQTWIYAEKNRREWNNYDRVCSAPLFPQFHRRPSVQPRLVREWQHASQFHSPAEHTGAM